MVPNTSSACMTKCFRRSNINTLCVSHYIHFLLALSTKPASFVLWATLTFSLCLLVIERSSLLRLMKKRNPSFSAKYNIRIFLAFDDHSIHNQCINEHFGDVSLSKRHPRAPHTHSRQGWSPSGAVHFHGLGECFCNVASVGFGTQSAQR